MFSFKHVKSFNKVISKNCLRKSSLNYRAINRTHRGNSDFIKRKILFRNTYLTEFEWEINCQLEYVSKHIRFTFCLLFIDIFLISHELLVYVTFYLYEACVYSISKIWVNALDRIKLHLTYVIVQSCHHNLSSLLYIVLDIFVLK